MKIEKFENISEKVSKKFINSINKMIDVHYEYMDFIEICTPFVIERYINFSKDPDYVPEKGSKPYKVKRNKITISGLNKHENGVEFIVSAYKYTYYIIFTFDEIEQIIIKQNTEKYNL